MNESEPIERRGEDFLMSHEQNQIVGQMMRERQAHVCHLTCLQKKAENQVQVLDVFSVALSNASQGIPLSMPPSDFNLSCEDMRRVLKGIYATQIQLRVIEKKLANMGITLSGE